MKMSLNDMDLIVRMTPRVAVVFCLDISSSMNKYDLKLETTLADEMVKAVNMFYDALKTDNLRGGIADVAIVAFNDDALVLEQFENVDFKTPFRKPLIGGGSNLEAGILKSLEMLDTHKQQCRDNDVDYLGSWLAILSDGKANSNIENSQRIVNKREKDYKLLVFPFALSEDIDLKFLNNYTNKKPIDIREKDIASYFEFIVDDRPIYQSNLDVRSFDTWFDTPNDLLISHYVERPIIIAIDTSVSMNQLADDGQIYIDKTVIAINNFIKEIKNDEHLSLSTKIAIVSLTDGSILKQPTLAYNMEEFLKPETSNIINIDISLNRISQLIENNKTFYVSQNRSYYRQWILTISSQNFEEKINHLEKTINLFDKLIFSTFTFNENNNDLNIISLKKFKNNIETLQKSFIEIHFDEQNEDS